MDDATRATRILSLVSLLAACGQPQAPRAEVAVEPEEKSAPASDPAAAEAAADRVRDSLYSFDPEACVSEGAAQQQAHPKHMRLRAWYLVCVAAAGRRIEADTLVKTLRREQPSEAWGEFARVAIELRASPIAGPELARDAEALVGALGEHPDALRLRAQVLLASGQVNEALAFTQSHAEALADMRLRALLKKSEEAKEGLPEALALVEKAQGIAATEAAQAAASTLEMLERFAEALPWIERAIAGSPGSVQLHQQKWQILQKLPERSETDRRDAIVADIAALLELRPRQPSALLAAARMSRELKVDERAEELEQRLMTEFEDSPATELLLYLRIIGAQAADLPDKARLRAQLDAFVARRPLHSLQRREEVARMRFDLLRDDPSTSPDALLAAIEFMREAGDSNAEATNGLGPIALAARSAHLERAEALAREGIEAVARADAEFRATGMPADIGEMIRRDRLGVIHDAIGAVLLAKGQLDEAEAALKQSQEVSPGYTESLARLAEIARRRGDLDAAEGYLAAGYSQEIPGRENPCRAKLAEIYRQRHGDMKGYERYVRTIEDRAREARRLRVIAGKEAAPRPAPAFALTRLDGAKVTSESLRGKIVLIKFWFTACEPCVAEIPEFKALIKDYSRDREVAIVSIHNDGTRDEIAGWMREKRHDFPVLLDEGYCEQAGISMFPTIWVLDREGRIAYTVAGSVGHLREEFGWRIESLRARG